MEKRNYKLYVHISPSNKRYYGITGRENCEYRWNDGKGYYKNEHFTNAINKYGWENFQHIVLFDNLTKEEACLLEQMYIALYDTANNEYGYNNSLGGEGTIGINTWERMDKETREKRRNIMREKMTTRMTDPQERIRISNTLKGHIVTEETRSKISKGNKENNARYWQGKSRSEETRKKISDKVKNTMDTPEVKDKLYKAWTEERKSKFRENNPMKKTEIATKLNGENNGMSKKLIAIDIKTGIKYPQDKEYFSWIGEACNYLKLDYKKCASGISACCNGKQNTSHGYIWKWYTEEQQEAI